MQEEELKTKLKRARNVALVLSTVTILSLAFAFFSQKQLARAEHNVELMERVKTLELDSCMEHNSDLNNYLQEVLYALEYEKKKNQSTN